MARNKKETINLNKSISNLIKMNTANNDLLNSASSNINGSKETRSDELERIQTQFQDIVKNEANNIFSNKSSKDNVYDYLVKNVFQLDPTDPISYNKMEKIFTGGDSTVSSYFMGNDATNFIGLCDQIESICSYLYQLEEAIDTIRDNVLACEEANEEISIDIKFPDMNEMNPEFIEHVRRIGDEHKLPQKLKDHIVPKAIKFGSYYVITMPYSDIYTKMSQYSNGNKVDNIVKEFSVSDFNKDIENTEGVEFIFENASKIRLYDQMDDSVPVLDEFKPLMESTIDEAITKEITKANNRKRDSYNYNSSTINKSKEDATILDGQIDLSDDSTKIPGCFIKLVDPRYMRPVKIFDHVLGYYYFEHFDTNMKTTSMSDIMGGNFNHKESETIVDNIVDKILKNLKYKELMQGDMHFKSLILNSLMHKESRENLMNIKFIPADYVVDFTTNKDEKGNGRPVLLRSLFFGRLYVSLLMFNISTLVTKSTDTEFYYMKDQLDNKYSNQISDVINQMRSSNIDPSSIMSGALMSGNKAIYKRYFAPLNEQGDKPFDIDVIPGQKIDLHDELMDKLLKMTIGSTGVSSVMIDNLDEIEFATIIAQANIKSMRRCISIQTDFNDPITQLYTNIVKYSNTQLIPEKVLESMKMTLRKPRMTNNNYQADSISVVQSTVTAMLDTVMKGQNTQLTELDEFVREELICDMTMELTPSLPWNQVLTKMESAVIKAKERQIVKNADGVE